MLGCCLTSYKRRTVFTYLGKHRKDFRDDLYRDLRGVFTHADWMELLAQGSGLRSGFASWQEYNSG